MLSRQSGPRVHGNEAHGAGGASGPGRRMLSWAGQHSTKTRTLRYCWFPDRRRGLRVGASRDRPIPSHLRDPRSLCRQEEPRGRSSPVDAVMGVHQVVRRRVGAAAPDPVQPGSGSDGGAVRDTGADAGAVRDASTTVERRRGAGPEVRADCLHPGAAGRLRPQRRALPAGPGRGHARCFRRDPAAPQA